MSGAFENKYSSLSEEECPSTENAYEYPQKQGKETPDPRSIKTEGQEQNQPLHQAGKLPRKRGSQDQEPPPLVEDEQEDYEEHWNGKTTDQFSTRELRLKAQITLNDGRTFEVQTLVDSGCTTSTIDKGFVKAKGIQTIPVNYPM